MTPTRIALIAAALALVGLAASLPPRTASADAPPTGTTIPPEATSTTPEQAAAELVALTNQARQANGLAPLVEHPCLTTAADQWATTIGTSGSLDHRSERGLSLATEVDNLCPGTWAIVGENLGRGPTVAAIQTAFMHSPTHHANIVEAAYTHIGIAVQLDDHDRIAIVVVQLGGVPLVPA